MEKRTENTLPELKITPEITARKNIRSVPNGTEQNGTGRDFRSPPFLAQLGEGCHPFLRSVPFLGYEARAVPFLSF